MYKSEHYCTQAATYNGEYGSPTQQNSTIFSFFSTHTQESLPYDNDLLGFFFCLYFLDGPWPGARVYEEYLDGMGIKRAQNKE